jgi:hypothetical protein
MKANRQNNRTSKALIIINIIAVILFAWIAISTIEVVSKNLDANPVYTAWNIYNLIG